MQSKEKLIASLKDAASVGGSPLDLSDSEGNRSNVSTAELEATTQECEQLRAELQRTQAQADALSADFHEQESALRRSGHRPTFVLMCHLRDHSRRSGCCCPLGSHWPSVFRG